MHDQEAIYSHRQSYDVEINMAVPGTTMKSTNVLDLKNPFFRYTGQQPQPPPGTNHTSPSESYWNQQDMSGTLQCVLRRWSIIKILIPLYLQLSLPNLTVTGTFQC